MGMGMGTRLYLLAGGDGDGTKVWYPLGLGMGMGMNFFYGDGYGITKPIPASLRCHAYLYVTRDIVSTTWHCQYHVALQCHVSVSLSSVIVLISI